MSSISIGGTTYPSKAAAELYARRILNDSPLGDVPDEHLRFVWGLLRLHPAFPRKDGCGTKMLQIRENLPYGTRSFWIVRQDGSETDFSYRECLYPSTHPQKIAAAFRAEVSEQIIRFRDAELAAGRCCAVTGAPIDPDDYEVDHVSPDTFAALLTEFLKSQKIDIADVRVHESDGQTKPMLQDRLLSSRWQDFHRSRARLRLLSREGHRTITRQGGVA